jgi:hypothetical protein
VCTQCMYLALCEECGADAEACPRWRRERHVAKKCLRRSGKRGNIGVARQKANKVDGGEGH